MNFDSFKNALVVVKNIPLPGAASQFKMSPPFREELIVLQKDKIKDAKKAAVMALFYPNKNKEAHIILILRKTYNGVHSAQVGFPGGKVEKEDSNLKITALRETEEEIGVFQNNITILKQLTQVYIPPSNFYVSPFIGISKSTPRFIKQDSEVEALIEVCVDDLINEKNVTTKAITIQKDKIVNVPAYKLNDHLVWGATAMMLSEIKELLKEVL